MAVLWFVPIIVQMLLFAVVRGFTSGLIVFMRMGKQRMRHAQAEGQQKYTQQECTQYPQSLPGSEHVTKIRFFVALLTACNQFYNSLTKRPSPKQGWPMI
jgi:predicted metalloprotease with PDZ domain